MGPRCQVERLTRRRAACARRRSGDAQLKGAVAARLSAVTLPKLADIRAMVTTQLAKFRKIELSQLNPALAAAGTPGRYHFDVETPSAEVRTALMQAYGDAVGRGAVDKDGFTGVWQGLEVQAWFSSDGTIVSAYPILENQ